MAKVKERMEEFQTWINHIRQTNLNEEIPMGIVISLYEVIQDNSPAVSVENMRQQVEEISRGVQFDRRAADNLKSLVINLQDKLDEILLQNISSRTLESREGSILHKEEIISGRKYPSPTASGRERDIVKKCIERLEKQILQLIGVVISREQINIALAKKCKTVDVPAVNSAIGNVQKALQKYVGFIGMDSDCCDKIGDPMDRAQAWCLDIEEIYNKAEVHSINTLKGDTENVGIFSDNSQVTVFDLLESAELEYLGWGNRRLIGCIINTCLKRLNLI